MPQTQQTLVAPAAPTIEEQISMLLDLFREAGIKPVASTTKEYAQRKREMQVQPDGTKKSVLTAELTGVVLYGESFQPATAGGQNVGRDIWHPIYRDAMLRSAMTLLVAASDPDCEDAPRNGTVTAAGSSARATTFAEIKARNAARAATVNGAVKI